MKATFAIVSLMCLSTIATSDSAESKCTITSKLKETGWIDMHKTCVDETRAQIKEEIKASMQYLAMGAHFSKDQVNRPGFAKLFFDSASEERQHAIKLISYLLMRGELTSGVSDLIQPDSIYQGVSESTWTSGADALKAALKLESFVTKSIKKVIKACEEQTNANDYHLVDYLTGEFLEEQYKGQREIAGRLSTLGKLMDKHGALGEFLFDKKLLSGEV